MTVGDPGRTLTSLSVSGHDIPWEESEPDPELEAQVKKYREENRPVLLELFSKYPDRKLLVFRSRQEADDWLASLAPHPGSKSAEGKT